MKCLKFTLLSLLVVLMANCISDDYDDCEKPFVYFSYRGDSIKQIFDEKIDKVDLYIFDSSKHLVHSRTMSKADLLKFQGTSLDFLSSGDYYMVCVGNAFSETAIQLTNTNHLDSMHIGNPNVFAQKEVSSNDPLYIGYKKITIPDARRYKTPNDTINFVSAHIKMLIQVSGLMPPTDETSTLNQFKLAINNLAASINYKNSVHNGQHYSYYPQFKYSTATKMYYTEINVLRFQKKSDITLDLINKSNAIAFSMRLEDFLAKYAEFDLTKNEVLLGIHIGFQGENISVKAPDWLINEEVKPEF